MEEQNTINNTLGNSVKLADRVFDLVMGRVFKDVYLKLEKKERTQMEKVFLSGNDKEKKEFIKKYIPNLEKLFDEQAKKIEEEIKSNI